MGFYIDRTYGNVIDYVIIGKWSMYYSAAYKWKEKKLYRLWMNEKWSDVLISRAKIHGPTSMGFGAWQYHVP